MARPITIVNDTHRLEQEAYRANLVVKREPEIGRVDTAITVAVYGLMREISEKDRVRDRKSLNEFMARTAAVLEAQGCDRERSLHVISRRLIRPPERFHELLGIEDDTNFGLLP